MKSLAISSRKVDTFSSVLTEHAQFQLYAVYATIWSSEKIRQTVTNTDQPMLLLNLQCTAINIAIIILAACSLTVFVSGIAPVT